MAIEDVIPSKKRIEVIKTNIDRVVGVEDGPLRDVDDGKFSTKPFRGVAKKENK